MKINSHTHIDLKQNAMNGNEQKQKPTLKIGAFTEHRAADRVEISQTGREMAVGVIEHHAANYFGTTEIHGSLTRLLDGKAPEVKKAVDALIQFNLAPGGTVAANEEERAALFEMGLSQAKYLADNYMKGEEADQFLATINQIASLTKHGAPPQKPTGAPDDYISISDMMKRFDPGAYAQMNAAVSSDGNWSKILIDFAKRVPENKEWVKAYREETDKQKADLQNAQFENRFQNADTKSMSSFLRDVNRVFAETSVGNSDVLKRNMEYFAHVLGHNAQG